jgi:hypothetical protein
MHPAIARCTLRSVTVVEVAEIAHPEVVGAGGAGGDAGGAGGDAGGAGKGAGGAGRGAGGAGGDAGGLAGAVAPVGPPASGVPPPQPTNTESVAVRRIDKPR